tara:strand:- start:1225 stop:1929 length:705 start_codon:yes stop_codon:yes gene_type:complete
MAKIINIIISPILYLQGAIVFVIGGIICLLLAIISRSLMFKYVPIFCHVMLFSMGVIIRKRGKFPEGGPFIIMSNHASFIDVFTVPPAIKGEYTAVVAAKNLKIPLFSTMLKTIKAVPVQRKNKEAARKSIQLAEQVIHDDQCSMVILPEGTRTIDGKLQPFKKGGFHMAINTKTSILLIAHRNAHLYKPKNRWTLSPRIIDVTIGPVINTENYNAENLNELIEKTWKEMNNLI